MVFLWGFRLGLAYLKKSKKLKNYLKSYHYLPKKNIKKLILHKIITYNSDAHRADFLVKFTQAGCTNNMVLFGP